MDQKMVSISKLDIDSVYEKIGGFGKFQIISYILTCLPLLLIYSGIFSFIFITGDVEYRCLIPECDNAFVNNTSQKWITRAFPVVDGKISKCEHFAVMDGEDNNGFDCPLNFNHSIVRCKEFVYLTKERNLLTEFNLTCQENKWKLTIVGSLGYISECLSFPFIGYVADKYGRQTTLSFIFLFASIFGIAKSFSYNYLTFLILHVLGSFFGGGGYGLVFVYGSEIVSSKNRGLGSTIIASVVSLALMLLATLSMYINDFRVLLRLIFGSTLISLLAFTHFVPESARWLLSIGNVKEGLEILEKTAKLNGSKITEETINFVTNDSENRLLHGIEPKNVIEKDPMIRALRSNKLFSRLMYCCLFYLTTGLIYNGLSVYSSILPGSKHMNVFYTGLVEIPSNVVTYVILKRFGRKRSLMCSLLLCSFACICSELIPFNYVKATLLLTGKFAITMSFLVLNIFSVELFPTNLRQKMFNICKIFAGVGFVLAPQIPLLANLLPSLPLLLFAGFSCSAALLVILMPETANKALPESVDDALKM